MSIWTGFEGYRDPAEDEVLDLLRSCTVVVDTNVFLDLYSFEQPARDLALDVLESLEDRLFVPHQVMREFWRNRHGVIATVAKPSQPLATVRDDLLGTVNSLRPDRQRPQDIEQLRTKIDQLLNELETAVDTARGEALEIHKILHDTSLDPVVNRLESILNGHIGPALGADESQLIEDGLKRFEKKVPPGYEDGSGKAGQIPERGTGDFLLWEQTLRQISTTGATAFVLVTGDSKEDWRTVITKPSKRALGVRPELVAEALDRTGAQFVLLSPTDFYRLMGRIRPSDGAASLSLVSATELLIESREQPGRGWTASAYRQLLSDLRADGNDAQADVIEFASLTGGFIRREDVYATAGYPDDRSLRRFSLPAQRAALALVDAGELREDADPPLEALYEGPGKTIGYRVPDEFARHAALDEGEEHDYTWIEAAAVLAQLDPKRIWTVDELVEGIVENGLKDVSNAKTPSATLGRDLRIRGSARFERVGSGYRLRSNR